MRVLHCCSPCCVGARTSSLCCTAAAPPAAQVPDKQFVLLQIWTHAAMHDWAQLQHMAGKLDRRAPVNIEHFVAAAR